MRGCVRREVEGSHSRRRGAWRPALGTSISCGTRPEASCEERERERQVRTHTHTHTEREREREREREPFPRTCRCLCCRPTARAPCRSEARAARPPPQPRTAACSPSPPSPSRPPSHPPPLTLLPRSVSLPSPPAPARREAHACPTPRCPCSAAWKLLLTADFNGKMEPFELTLVRRSLRERGIRKIWGPHSCEKHSRRFRARRTRCADPASLRESRITITITIH